MSGIGDILFEYHKVHPTTWVHLSSLLTICVYFKFSRLWSVRNLDLVGLILLAPGLLMVAGGGAVGYVWLFVMGGLFMVRLLLDPMMVRRPLLEPNLSVGGMTFLGTSLFIFLMANVLNSSPTTQELADAERADRQWAGAVNVSDSAQTSDAQTSNTQASNTQPNSQTLNAPGSSSAVRPAFPGAPAAADNRDLRGPGYPLLYSLPNITTQALPSKPADVAREDRDARGDVVRTAVSRTVVILSHLAIIIGMVLIGFRHFDNIKTGIAAATLYLLVPYTAQFMGHPAHVLPAALVIWAIQCYRRPLIAGLLMGTAVGVLYPIFLLPLWLGFYWPRGLWRFGLGVAIAVGVLIASLAFTSQPFWPQFQQFFGLVGISPSGFWSSEHVNTVYRIPVLAAFFALCGSLTLWPAQKNLGTLMSCSAAVMVAAQFWMASGGGLHIAWYLPLLLLTIFRPNLEDRVALNALSPRGWDLLREWNARLDAGLRLRLRSELGVLTPFERGERIPSYDEILKAGSKTEWYAALTPLHHDKGEKWHDDPTASKPMSEKLYYATIWLLYNGTANPLPHRAPGTPGASSPMIAGLDDGDILGELRDFFQSKVSGGGMSGKALSNSGPRNP